MVREVFENIDLNGIKGVLIDLDDTLYPYPPNHLRSMDKCKFKCSDFYGIPLDLFDSHFKSARERVHHELHGQAASHSRLLYFQKFSESFFGQTNPVFA